MNLNIICSTSDTRHSSDHYGASLIACMIYVDKNEQSRKYTQLKSNTTKSNNYTYKTNKEAITCLLPLSTLGKETRWAYLQLLSLHRTSVQTEN